MRNQARSAGSSFLSLLLALVLLSACSREDLPDNNPNVPLGTPAPVLNTPTPGPEVQETPALLSAAERLARLAENSRIWKVEEPQLVESELVFKRVWEFYTDTNKGGFKQYYLNDSGNEAGDCPAALEEIGAPKTAELLRRANALFGDNGPPLDREMRVGELLRIAPSRLEAVDAALEKHEEDLIALLSLYVERNRLELREQARFRPAFPDRALL